MATAASPRASMEEVVLDTPEQEAPTTSPNGSNNSSPSPANGAVSRPVQADNVKAWFAGLKPRTKMVLVWCGVAAVFVPSISLLLQGITVGGDQGHQMDERRHWNSVEGFEAAAAEGMGYVNELAYYDHCKKEVCCEGNVA